MTEQGVGGRDCAWCGLPAVGELEVQPARYRTVSRRGPVSGERATYQAFVRAAILCHEHEQIGAGQPAPVAIPRQRTAHEVEQLAIFPSTADERSRNAIYRETAR